MANTGNGEKAVEKTDNQPTAESSQPLTRRGKKPTSRTSALTPDLALEILQEAVIRCQQAGIQIGVSPFFDAGKRKVVIVLEGVDLVSDNLVLASEESILTLTVLVVLAMLAVREPAGDELPALLLAPSLTATSTVASTLTTPAPTAITPMPSQTPVLAVVTAHGLRIRACASHTCRTVGWLRYGDQVQVRSCQSGWAYLPGRGWSRSIYLEPDICNNK